jgi:hypothetical protein
MRWEAEEGMRYQEVRKQIEALLQDAHPDATPVWVEADQAY